MNAHTAAVGQSDPSQIMQTGLGFWASKTLLSAVELGLFTELSGKPQTLQNISSHLGLHPRSAHDFLDALVALGFVRRENGEYSNAPSTDFFLDRNKPSYIGGILEMASAQLFTAWSNLTEALRTGECQNESKGSGLSPFETFYSDPERLRQFLKAMTAISKAANCTIAAQFPWKNYKTAADIGTAQGDLIVQVALANPHLTGIGFDLPQVRSICEEYIAANGLASRIAFHTGSFFENPLPRADVLMMGHILQDWNLEEKNLLIQKAFEAVPSGGALIVYESIIDDDRSKNVFGLLMSLNMLIETPGGFDYTGADCMGWIKEAGFKETRTEHLAGPDFMVVGIK